MKKNLVYYIVDSKYSDMFEYNISLLYKYTDMSDIDVCCITPQQSNTFLKNNPQVTHVYEIAPFDYRYTAKFLIGTWPKSSLYENFLYLDTDAVPIKSILEIYDEIDRVSSSVHGVVEAVCLNKQDHYHRYSQTVFAETAPAYNAGTFGFNKKLLELINQFVSYITNNRNNAFLDQSLFNEFFTARECIIPTLSKYVHLFNEDNIYKDINKIPIHEATIVHFLGNAYSGKHPQMINNILTPYLV
jgi:hypothetical protein